MLEGLRLAGGEGLADERSQVLVVAYGGGEEELVKLVAGVIAVRRNNFPARGFGGVHRLCSRGRRSEFRDLSEKSTIAVFRTHHKGRRNTTCTLLNLRVF